jgi:hypothetical protein
MRQSGANSELVSRLVKEGLGADATIRVSKKGRRARDWSASSWKERLAADAP